MQYKGMNILRKEYLDFFESKDHNRLKSFSLVPEGDKSLLLINAGMAPLKAYFLGEKKMAHNRATSSQRCLRTADIDNVGKTDRHATFFEMLGNFSFGDYFKKEAISWAWEFLTEKVGLEKDSLWVSVYEEDDQAYNIWHEKIGLPAERILRLGKEDNFWELDQGPCGPCSEIHYDRGEKYGPGKNPTENSDRYMEIWNLVFTQFNREADGSYIPLAHPNIDTGMGLERLALLMEDKANIFELDEFIPLRNEIERMSGKKYGKDDKTDESFRVIIDHSKAMNFLVLDGVIPSNEGRGYILRRLIRRAARHGKLLGIKGEFLTKLSPFIRDAYKEEYSELEGQEERIKNIIAGEEDKFQQTIDQGLSMLEELMAEAEEKSLDYLDKEKVFRLYDTYGFPVDLTAEIAAEKNMKIDREDFAKRMAEQRDLSRAGRKAGAGWEDSVHFDTSGLEKTEFTGYEFLNDRAKVLRVFNKEGEIIDRLDFGEAVIVFDKTPFYAEGGGQVTDIGDMTWDGGSAKVEKVVKDKDEIFLHTISLKKGTLAPGLCVKMEVAEDRRNDIRRNHSATHLLNKALRMVLGDHINQAGSLVDPDHLRFDFSHFQAMTKDEIKRVEEIVNRAIFDSYPVKTEILPLDKAMEEGAIGLFEDKYHDQVRVLSMGDFSKELCGGTHVDNTSQIQMFRILSEQGISSGVRRIVAISGRACYRQAQELDQKLDREADLLKVNVDMIEDKIGRILDENKELRQEIDNFKAKEARDLSKEMSKGAKDIGGINLISRKLEGLGMDQLKELADALKEDENNEIIVLVSSLGDKVFWLVAIQDQLTKKGFKAGDLVKLLAQATGGNGGGRPNFATAGGKDKTKIDQTIDLIEGWIEEKLS